MVRRSPETPRLGIVTPLPSGEGSEVRLCTHARPGC